MVLVVETSSLLFLLLLSIQYAPFSIITVILGPPVVGILAYSSTSPLRLFSSLPLSLSHSLFRLRSSFLHYAQRPLPTTSRRAMRRRVTSRRCQLSGERRKCACPGPLRNERRILLAAPTFSTRLAGRLVVSFPPSIRRGYASVCLHRRHTLYWTASRYKCKPRIQH